MTKEKYTEVLALYRSYLANLGVPAIKVGVDEFIPDNVAVLSHCHAMLAEMKEFLEQGKFDKLNRWLGFMQGCFFTLGIYSLRDLKEHNRP